MTPRNGFDLQEAGDDLARLGLAAHLRRTTSGIIWTAGRRVAANGVVRSTLSDQPPDTHVTVTLAAHEYTMYRVQVLAGSVTSQGTSTSARPRIVVTL